MAGDEMPQSSIIHYQTEDGRTRIEWRCEAETIWLTQVNSSHEAPRKPLTSVNTRG